MKNRHGHWVCWMSTGRKNGLMWRTRTGCTRTRIPARSCTIYSCYLLLLTRISVISSYYERAQRQIHPLLTLFSFLWLLVRWQASRNGSPNHPSYPSGHAVQNGAFATVLKVNPGFGCWRITHGRRVLRFKDGGAPCTLWGVFPHNGLGISCPTQNLTSRKLKLQRRGLL